MSDISVIGIDIAKTWFHFCAGSSTGRVLERKKAHRDQVFECMENMPRCLVLMEACGGANYWGREFVKMGFKVKLIAAQFVKPYRKSNKNDRADAEAIMEAGLRPTMRFVGVKAIKQQDIQSIHRVRQLTIKRRTMLANEIRGLLMEYGVIINKGITHVRKNLWETVDSNKSKLTEVIIELVRELKDEFKRLDERINALDKQLEAIASEHPVCKRLMKREGVGPTISTAMISLIGDPHMFRRGRELSAYLGMVPKQNTTGGKPKLGGISKRGDKYVRQLLIHGARSVVMRAEKKTDTLSVWINRVRRERGFNKACVALANKNTRVLWALMVSDKEYEPAV
jgi:transposase